MAVLQRRSTSAPERWEPMQEIEQTANRMQRLLEETFGGAGPLLMDVTAWSPPVDIEEADDAYIVEAEVPGVKRDDVNIEVVGNELTISGEIKEKERVGIVRRRTRRTGRFEYHVTLPAAVDSDKIDAKLDNGVLTVRIPKSERGQRRKIEVKS
jgi:HSP20 family protein